MRPLAFTLIELLTVIAIIAILMALLFPIPLLVKENARQKKASSDLRVITNAVEQFNVEYGRYPMLSGSSSATDEACGDSAAGLSLHNATLFHTLRAIDKEPNASNAQNPRRQVYLDTRIVSDPNAPRGGFLDGANAGAAVGSFYDPWGSEYCVVIDTDSDNRLNVGSFYSDFGGENAPRVSVGAFSIGKDKSLGKKGNHQYHLDNSSDTSDDRLSWVN